MRACRTNLLSPIPKFPLLSLLRMTEIPRGSATHNLFPAFNLLWVTVVDIEATLSYGLAVP